MKRGEIYQGRLTHRKNNVCHYVVCIEDVTLNKDYFEACVLTHSDKYGNIRMEKKHFDTFDENGNKYPFQFENTCLVQKVFEKKVFWIEEPCIGKLSKSGLEFILARKEQFGPAIFYPKRLRGKKIK